MKNISIAIDGPAGAGKSTIARIVSKALGILYLDTGAMYRAVALKAIRKNICTKDGKALSILVKDINIEIKHLADEQRVFLDGEDVSGMIRSPGVSIAASDVSSVPEIRIKMVELQREIASKNSVVMDGRDIGTFVLPDADFKFFLTASAEERARRRYLEQVEKGMAGFTLEDVRRDMEYRDLNDSSREFAPLKKAPDALEIDTTDMSVSQVAEKILNVIRMGDKCFTMR